MSLFKSELARYVSYIESHLSHHIPATLTSYGDDTRKDQIHAFVLTWGKRLRPALAMMMADELDYPSTESLGVFCALEVFHDFILAHDDIIDRDAVRRNQPTLHTAMQSNLADLMIADRQHFGHAQAIIGWDVLYALSQECIIDSDLKSSRKIALLKLMTQTMQSVARGRYKQFLSDYLPLSEVSLDYIITHNLIDVTGRYTFLFPLLFGHIIATGERAIDPELTIFADELGIVFQTGDDVIGLFGDPTVTGKSDSGDIIQGKKTIPMYFAYQHAPAEDKVFLETHLGKKDLSDTDIVRIKKIVTDYGMEPTKQFLTDHAQLCRESLARLPYSDHWKSIFSDLIDYLMERKF